MTGPDDLDDRSGRAGDGLDHRLRRAGAGLRATAPGPEATEAALDGLGRAGASRWMWMLPAGLVAAAAAILAVVVVDRPDDQVQAPADTGATVATVTALPGPTPATTSAPTVVTAGGPGTSQALTTAPTTAPVTAQPTPAPTTSSPATAAPSAPPGETSTTTAPAATLPTVQPDGGYTRSDVDLDTAASIMGCPGTFGDVAAAVADGPVHALRCADDLAAVIAGEPSASQVVVVLGRDGGAWQVLDRGEGVPCTTSGRDVCAAFGVGDVAAAPLPLAPAAVAASGEHLPAADAGEELARLGPVTGSVDDLAAALARQVSEEPVPAAQATDDGRTAVITLTGVPDDSSSSQTYVVEYVVTGGVIEPLRAARFVRCDRGITGDLCV